MSTRASKVIYYFCWYFLIGGFLLPANGQSLDQTAKDSLFRLGQNFYKQVDIYQSKEKNITLIDQAIPAFKASEKWTYLANSYNWLALIHYYDENFEASLQATQEAMHIAEKHLEKNSDPYSAALNNLSTYYQEKGDYPRAIQLLLETIPIAKTLKEGPALISIYYQNIGTAYQELGDYDEAIYYLRQALDIRYQIPQVEDPDIAGVLSNIADCFKEKNQLDSARVLFNQSLAHCETLPHMGKYVQQIQLYNYQSLAAIHLQEAAPQLALPYLQKALTLQKEQSFLGDHKTYLILGELHLNNKAYPQAIKAFEQALNSSQRTYKDYEKHPEIARAYKALGDLHQQMRKQFKALVHYHQALQTLSIDSVQADPRQVPNSKQYMNPMMALDILHQKAQLLSSIKQETHELEISALKSALAHYQLAAVLIKSLRQRFLAEGSKNLLAAKVLAIYEGGIGVALHLYEILKDPVYLEQAFVFAEGNKALGLLESIAKTQAIGYGQIPDSLLDKERSLRLNKTFYDNRIKDALQKKEQPDSSKIALWEKEVFELREAHKALIRYFEEAFPQYHQLKYPNENIALAKLQEALGKQKNTALLEYFIGQEKSYVFCFLPNGLTVFDLDEVDLIFRDITQLRGLISQAPMSAELGKQFPLFCGAAHRLYQHLLQASLATIPTDIAQLILIPDDALNYLPFELLLSQLPKDTTLGFIPQNLHYLLNDFQLSYHYSARLWLDQMEQAPSEADRHFVAYAPSFGSERMAETRDCDSEELSDLACNQAEIEQISQLLNGAERKAHLATRAQFEAEARHFKIIHLATHACVNDEQPGQSQIFFADGELLSNEVYNLELQADLVVLSACNTGSGKLVKGEGVMSLTRGFIHAGSPSALMSLWSVDDCATADIMLAYYRGLHQYQDKASALQSAKIHYLQNCQDQLRAHPYYWSAFVQFGNTAPIDLSTKPAFLVYFAGLGLALLIALLGWQLRQKA
ncbi:MAG: CHAT domain-containing tetratricopeptide repeat protein [Bacteroidota bacterium]